MSLRGSAQWIAAILAGLGLACLVVRWNTRRQVVLGQDDTLWRITYQARFQATRAGAKLRVSIPSDTPSARVYRQDVLYTGLSAERLRSGRTMAREMLLVAAAPGQHTVTGRFDVHLSPAGRWKTAQADSALTPQERDEALRATAAYPLDNPAIQETLASLKEGLPAGAEPARRIFEFCSSQISAGGGDAPHDAVTAIRQRYASPLGRARAMVALCRAGKVPARLLTGFAVLEAERLELRFCVEARVGGRWVPYDPARALSGQLPHNFVPVRRDGAEVVRGTDIAALETSFHIARLPAGPGASRLGHGHWLGIFDLTRLPLEMHDLLAVVLLLPLGALVTAFFRTVVGLRTFGTFTPTLLALSFVYADLFTGLLTLGAVLAIGLTSRAWLDRLKLLLVPRLSVMLTLVVLSIVLLVSVLDYVGLTPSAQAVILPMVILTMMIERFYLTAEEDSPAFAAQLLGTTLIVGACCYGILRWEAVGRFVFAFPEVHLLTVAALILLGRYSGYRLNELWRFGDVARPKE